MTDIHTSAVYIISRRTSSFPFSSAFLFLSLLRFTASRPACGKCSQIWHSLAFLPHRYWGPKSSNGTIYTLFSLLSRCCPLSAASSSWLFASRRFSITFVTTLPPLVDFFTPAFSSLIRETSRPVNKRPSRASTKLR